MGSLWFTLLYQPFLNALIWIYVNVAGQNLGVAVVLMTIGLRIVLLPFSVLSERSSIKQRGLEVAIEKVAFVYKNDPVAQKEEVRRLMKQHHISPWARVLTVVAQAVLFIVIYQVFINGVNNEQIAHNLYTGVTFPGRLNTKFFGFDISLHYEVLWAAINGVYLFVSILVWGLVRHKNWNKSDLYFLIFFPATIFVVLWYLPMVKALFFLTTIVFSDSIKVLFSLLNAEKKAHGAHGEKTEVAHGH
jgi:membrane protein insertase Oxa1/YidC/SpoIIIJ